MRTLRYALILSLVAVAPAFGQEAIQARTLGQAWHAPRLLSPPAPVVHAPDRPGPLARFRRAFRPAIRDIAAEYARSRSLELEVRDRVMSNHVAAGAVVGGALGVMVTANGCGADFHECPTAKYLVAGAGAGVLVAVLAHQSD